MKEPINMFHATIGHFISNLSLQREFVKGWGTTSYGGYQVFHKERLVYPRAYMDNDVNFVKLLKKLKMYDSIVQSINNANGIELMYITLNANKLLGGSLLEDQLISEKIEDLFPVNVSSPIWFTMNLNMDLPSALTISSTKSEVLTYLGNNWGAILNDDTFEMQSKSVDENDGARDGYYQLVMFDLLAEQRDFEIIINDLSFSTRIKPTTTYTDDTKYTTTEIVKTISIEVKFRRIDSIAVNSPIITAAKNPKRAIRTQYKDENGNIQSEMSYEYFSAANASSDLFVGGYLKTEILDPSYIGFNNRLFTNLIQILFDTRYVEKKVKWWKKALVIIVAIVIVVATWGWGAPIALSLGSLALGLMSMYFAKNGEPGVAKYAAKGSKTVGYAAMAAGIIQIVQQGFKAWLGDTLTSRAGAVMQVLNIVAPMYYKSKLDDIQGDINSMAGKIEQQERAMSVMSDNDLPIAKTLTNEQMNPLNTIEGTHDFDSSYEPTGKWKDNLYEGGCNICATHNMPTIKTDRPEEKSA